MRTIQGRIRNIFKNKLVQSSSGEVFLIKGIENDCIVYTYADSDSKGVFQDSVLISKFFENFDDEEDTIISHKEFLETNPEEFYILFPPNEIVKLRKSGKL